MPNIDLNADLGEGCGDDAAILACISSANIACGGHAGDQSSMQVAVDAAISLGVHIGAHPSYPDRNNFGRLEMNMPAAELRTSLIQQISDLNRICSQRGTRMRHVKPHGALYNQAARDPVLARVICDAVEVVDPSLTIVGLAQSELTRVAAEAGFAVLHEAFIDRRYQANGQLVPRSQEGACIDEIELAIEQAMTMLVHQKVKSIDGELVVLQADTLCLHGDGVHALQLARSLKVHLQNLGWVIA